MSRSKGIGDSIEKFTKTTGIKKLSQIAASSFGYNDCGCNKRRDWLNEQFPYKQK